MTSLANRQAAIEPVRAALIRRASTEAEALLATARADAAALVADARREAAGLVERARQGGAAQAAPVAAAELSRSRRQTRALGLSAERAVHDAIAGQVRTAVLGLRDQPGYPELRDRLAALAVRTAGAGAVISDHPQGGVVAHGTAVIADCSLPRLADLAITALDARIAGLCGP